MSVLSKCFLSFVSLAMSGSICTAQQACTLTHVTVQKLMDSDLRYQLIARFGPVRFCDPYCAGPCNVVRARKDAQQAFSKIQQDERTFRLIREHLGLQRMPQASPAQKADIFSEYVKLVCGVSIEPHGEEQKFTVKTADGFRIEGVVKKSGDIVVTDKELTAVVCPK
jgi:hypothetical protein